MAEVLMEFSNELRAGSGGIFEARACGRQRDDGLWEGWIEFVAVDGKGEALRTGRETTQPNEADIRYWATGLTGPYLEGALARAEGPAQPAPRKEGVTAEPAFDGPADHRKDADR